MYHFRCVCSDSVSLLKLYMSYDMSNALYDGGAQVQQYMRI